MQIFDIEKQPKNDQRAHIWAKIGLTFKFNKAKESLGAAGPRAAALAGVRGRSPRGIYNTQ